MVAEQPDLFGWVVFGSRETAGDVAAWDSDDVTRIGEVDPLPDAGRDAAWSGVVGEAVVDDVGDGQGRAKGEEQLDRWVVVGPECFIG